MVFGSYASVVACDPIINYTFLYFYICRHCINKCLSSISTHNNIHYAKRMMRCWCSFEISKWKITYYWSFYICISFTTSYKCSCVHINTHVYLFNKLYIMQHYIYIPCILYLEISTHIVLYPFNFSSLSLISDPMMMMWTTFKKILANERNVPHRSFGLHNIWI